MSDIQLHKLKDGSTVEIERKKIGRGHRYLINGENPVKSMTSVLGHIDSDAFGIGMNWALKQARLANDFDAPKRIGNQAREAGELLHGQIEEFINTGTIAEDPVFLAWHWLMDGLRFSEGLSLVATERFVYDSYLNIGGTVDCIAQTVEGEYHLLDWKTKDPESFSKYGPSAKDFTQTAGYVQALRNMNSAWQPTKAWIVYVMRDGSRAERVEVPLEKYIPIYQAVKQLDSLLQGVK